MAGDHKDDAESPRQPRSSDAEINRYRTDRQRPKTVTRPAADKMARPGTVRGYETK